MRPRETRTEGFAVTLFKQYINAFEAVIELL